MVHVRFINDQETVVTVPVRPDVDAAGAESVSWNDVVVGRMAMTCWN